MYNQNLKLLYKSKRKYENINLILCFSFSIFLFISNLEIISNLMFLLRKNCLSKEIIES